MADLQFALSELGAALAATDTKLSTSLEILGVAIQELTEAELTTLIGAGHGERTPTRTTQRNGHRPKLLSDLSGDIEVGIPMLRAGSFFPEPLEPRRRIDKALWAVMMTAYITGTSTRKVDDLVKALGCDTGVSKSSVSRICKGIDDDVAVRPSARRPVAITIALDTTLGSVLWPHVRIRRPPKRIILKGLLLSILDAGRRYVSSRNLPRRHVALGFPTASSSGIRRPLLLVATGGAERYNDPPLAAERCGRAATSKPDEEVSLSFHDRPWRGIEA